MKEWIDIVVPIVALVSLVGSGTMAWLWAVKYRIPNFETRLKAIEDTHSDGGRTLVHKHELYRADGRALYMHRSDCDQRRAECGGDREDALAGINDKLVELCEQLTAMDKARQSARTNQIAFMTAVKEKLKLEFQVPQD